MIFVGSQFVLFYVWFSGFKIAQYLAFFGFCGLWCSTLSTFYAASIFSTSYMRLEIFLLKHGCLDVKCLVLCVPIFLTRKS